MRSKRTRRTFRPSLIHTLEDRTVLSAASVVAQLAHANPNAANEPVASQFPTPESPTLIAIRDQINQAFSQFQSNYQALQARYLGPPGGTGEIGIQEFRDSTRALANTLSQQMGEIFGSVPGGAGGLTSSIQNRLVGPSSTSLVETLTSIPAVDNTSSNAQTVFASQATAAINAAQLDVQNQVRLYDVGLGQAVAFLNGSRNDIHSRPQRLRVINPNQPSSAEQLTPEINRIFDSYTEQFAAARDAYLASAATPGGGDLTAYRNTISQLTNNLYNELNAVVAAVPGSGVLPATLREGFLSDQPGSLLQVLSVDPTLGASSINNAAYTAYTNQALLNARGSTVNAIGLYDQTFRDAATRFADGGFRFRRPNPNNGIARRSLSDRHVGGQFRNLTFRQRRIRRVRLRRQRLEEAQNTSSLVQARQFGLNTYTPFRGASLGFGGLYYGSAFNPSYYGNGFYTNNFGTSYGLTGPGFGGVNYFNRGRNSGFGPGGFRNGFGLGNNGYYRSGYPLYPYF